MFTSWLKRLGRGLFLSLFLFSSAHAAPNDDTSDLLQTAKKLHLADSKAWLLLLHMQKTFWGGLQSEARNDLFLLSKRRDDPKAELAATLAAILHADGRCRFPARTLFLTKALHIPLDRLPAVTCEKYDQFRNRVGAKSVAVVFSSYFLNNPASAFGHSFLRLSHEKNSPGSLEINQTEKYELLDYGIGYAANPTTSNPILYSLGGLLGWFQGSWTSIPYYYKVREYNDFDSRDLWSYSLNFSQEEIDMLVAHLWEVGGTTFDYFYFTRNCSYEILAALEAAKPELDLLERLHTHVIPSDTIKTLYQTPNLVTKVTFRPSIRSQLFSRYDRLTSSEQKQVRGILQSKSQNALDASQSAGEKAAVLDTALDGLDFLDPNAAVTNGSSGGGSPLKSMLLKVRSHVPFTSEPSVVEPDPYDRPHLGHDSHRLGWFVGGSDSLGGYTQLSYRFAHHDFADQVTGYPKYADIEFFSFLGRYNSGDHSLWLEDLSIFHVISLSPWSSLKHPLSWEVKLGSETVRDGRCHDCSAGLAQLGGGASLDLASPLTASFLLEAQAWGTPKFNYGFFQFSAGPKARLLYRYRDRFQALVSSSYYENLNPQDHFSFTNELEAQWNFTSTFALRLIGKNLSSTVKIGDNEASLGGLYYF